MGPVAPQDQPQTETEVRQVEPAAISKPQGGGAVRSIGEKFAANPVTGTGSLSVPISVPPSRDGSAPSLSIAYDSGAGNGPFGFGWRLGTPSISRKTEARLPEYQDETEGDVFLLTGSEDLVPVTMPGGLQRPAPALRALPDGRQFDVRSYRPRIEGLYARIERWTDRNTGISHWRSISKDNTTTLYGFTPESRIADPSDATRVYTWLICESFDDKGNATAYRYKAEDLALVDRTRISERNRTPLSVGCNRHLKRVCYGNRLPHVDGEDLSLRTDWMFEIVFDYGEHYSEDADGQPVVAHYADDQRPWTPRQDPFSSTRSGFEIRTYRLCRNILTYHRFPELGPNPHLTRVLSLDYRETPVGSFIRSVTEKGIGHSANGALFSRSLPPLELEYSIPVVDPTVRTLDRAALANLREGAQYQWADLDAEGMSGVVTEQGGAWFYKRNIGGGRMAPISREHTQPSAPLAAGTQLLDLAGDGPLDAVTSAGFFERNQNASWSAFTAFKQTTTVSWTDANARFLDLTGAGRADLLIAGDDVFTWYESRGEDGYGPARQVKLGAEEEAGPRLLFAEAAQSIYLGDMNGDGLVDLIRVRNGAICYWPNLGFGRFGAKVTMDSAPWFDTVDQFDAKRLRLADIDGTGVLDVIYLHGDGIRLYFNESGNGWAAPQVITEFPSISDVSRVSASDLLGNGTACLVWSSPLPGDEREPLRYIDLMGGQKPHLLVRSRNNMGSETRLTYTASTAFYVADREAGRPWATRLPFPVHAVTRVESIDHLSRNRFVTRYAYHHGYFDGVEREFRGFGMVEQWDTEEIGSLAAAIPAANEDAACYLPPVRTCSWFHTGAFEEGRTVSEWYSREYWRPPGQNQLQFEATLLPDPLPPGNLTASEQHAAARALKGSLLRQEVFAEDGSLLSDTPYTVSERAYAVRLIQPEHEGHSAIFAVHQTESLDYNYERAVQDPRIRHEITVAVDAFGNVLESATVAYGRSNADAALAFNEQQRQAQTWITYRETEYTNAIDANDAWRTPASSDTRTFELLNEPVPAIGRFTVDTVKAAFDNAQTIAFELPSDGTPQKRIIERERTIFRSDDLTGPLPLGTIESMALPFETHHLALTVGHVAQVYGARVNNAMLAAAGYIHSNGDADWWTNSGHSFFSPNAADTAAQELAFARQHFFLPHRMVDAFGGETTVEYDAHVLLKVRTQDQLGNTSLAENDYGALQTRRATDANGQHSLAAFDVFGMLTGTAVSGKNGEGDDLTALDPNPSAAAVEALMADPLATSAAMLAQATSCIVYDVHAFYRTRNDPNPQAAAVCTIKRRTHVSELAAGQSSTTQVAISYLDGYGKQMQQKAVAEDGPVTTGGPVVSPRWVGTGWKVFNNKGSLVREYEPFFTSTPAFEFGHASGVATTYVYDALRRAIGRLHPNHTWDKTVHASWRREKWDVNDTSAEADPKNDPHLGDFFRRIPDADYLPTWRDARRFGQLGVAEQAAAQKTFAHAGTSSVEHLDALGRPFMAVSDNGAEGLLRSISVLDAEGSILSTVDAEDRLVVRSTFDVLGRESLRESMEAGATWTLRDVSSKTVFAWNNADVRTRTQYDALRRVTHFWLSEQGGAERLIHRTVFGEAHPDSQAGQAGDLNLRGQAWLRIDSSGLIWSSAIEPGGGPERGYDFEGNLLWSRKRIASEYDALPDWSALEPLLSVSPVNPAAIDAAANALLEPGAFIAGSVYDALSRPVRKIAPGGNVTTAFFNAADLLERVEVSVRGAAPTAFLASSTYNERGQRVETTLGNGLRYTWEFDPLRFRLLRQQTLRGVEVLQDLSYTYDAIGNVVAARDAAQQPVYFNNAVVNANSEYTYDPVYRLRAATGREHQGQLAQPQTDWRDEFRSRQNHPHDGGAMRRYTEQYDYDRAGNLLELRHTAANGNWTRTFTYNEVSQLDGAQRSNRLTQATVGAVSDAFAYDAQGNLTSVPHLTGMSWDALGRLGSVDTGGGGIVRYVYDSQGQRRRRVWEKARGLVEERIYLDTVEIFRVHDGAGNVSLEREALHVSDSMRTIAMVESRIAGADGSPARLDRYRAPNYLDSTSLETDDAAQLISYEEYYPYGATSYQAARAGLDTNPKRYRFTGKERDEESGFYYHGARYYAPWLCRWISADPAGVKEGINLYRYCSANPVNFSDPTGEADREPTPDEVSKLKARGITDPATQKRLVNIKPPKPDERYAVDSYGNQSKIKQKDRKGGKNIQGHHPIQDKWAKENVAGYNSDKAPSHFLETGTGQEHTSITNDQRAHKPAGGWGDKSYSDARAEAVDQYKNADLLTDEKQGVKALMESDGHFFGISDDVRVNPDTGQKEVIKHGKLAEHLDEAEKLIAKNAKGVKVLKSLGKAGRHALAAIPVFGILAGHASAAHAASEGDYTGAVLDEAGFIPVAGDLLDAGRAGVAVGEAMDEGLGISGTATEHGLAVEDLANDYLSEDVSRGLGAVTAGVSALGQGAMYLNPFTSPFMIAKEFF